MLKSCQYCGRIHDTKVLCNQKKQAQEKRWKNRRGSDAMSFRNTNAWKKQREIVKQRDRYICLCCKALLPGTIMQYNTNDLSVHHITPIEEDYELRLSDENLITVCELHHEMCEAGAITREQQMTLVMEAMRADRET